MTGNDMIQKAKSYLERLCSVEKHRRTGSAGNREATEFFAYIVKQFGYEVDVEPFPCLDFVSGSSALESGNDFFELFVSPYSLGCDVTAELVAVDSIEALEQINCQDKLLLMHGSICVEQLMPKNFVFYNPDHHKKIYALLEEKNPAAIITATAANPEMVGALYPFPLIIDGDFDIPNGYTTEVIGETISQRVGDEFRLAIEATRIPAMANNIIAIKNPDAEEKIVITAHIDTYENTPGASDNGSGTVVLLLLAEILAEYNGDFGIEIAAFNGEDHYSVGGQMDYLKRYGDQLGRIAVVINIDDVGYIEGKSSYSYYGCPIDIQDAADKAFGEYGGLIPGEPWFNGDHMIFVQQQVPAIAFTAEKMAELMTTITHTPLDTLDVVDPAKVVEVAQGIKTLVQRL